MTAATEGPISDRASSAPEPGAQPAELTPAEALGLAVQLHQAGETDIAEILYTRILEAAPDYADALHYFGILRHQTGQAAEALALVRRAIALTPDDAGMHNNLGNILAELDRPDEAAAAYRAAIALVPSNAEAHNNLGASLRAMGRFEEAEASYRSAIAANRTFRDAYDNLGRLLSNTGRVKEAIACHTRALEFEPRSANSRRFLVAAYGILGEVEPALEVLDGWLRDEPANPVALHLRAAISGRDVPERASDIYVETVFDRFAAKFDDKLKRLNYRAPSLVAEAVGAACGEPGADSVILDAGCGTGLCGPLLAPFGSHLTGVDLSSGMLAKARERGCYDDLVKAELTEFMQQRPARFDLIVSADTLCYFGALQAVIAAAASALRAGGLLVFSVENEAEDVGVRLNQHGRYSHHAGHVTEALASAGLHEAEIRHAILRREGDADVMGLLVTARKPQPG